MLRWLTAGESHGPALLAILEGLPAGVAVTTDDVAAALARRRLGYGRGARMTFERDEVELLGGVRHGRTQGGPVAVRIGNTEWPKWQTVMSADPVPADVLEGLARNAPLTRPRPGHADLVGHAEVRLRRRPAGARAGQRPGDGGPGRARRRRARRSCEQAVGARLVSHVVSIGTADAPDGVWPEPDDVAAAGRRPGPLPGPGARAPPWSPRSTPRQKAGDTLGGVVEVLAYGLPPGLGSHVHWDRRLDSRLAGALMGIQAIKGVEVGDGFDSARRPRLAGARRDRARRRRGAAPAYGASRRHRGRDDDRRAAAGARGHEADLDGAARAGHRRRRHRGAGPRHQPAQRRLCRAGGRHRRRGDGRAGAGRRGAGEVRRRLGGGDRAQRGRRTSRTCRSPDAARSW